MSGFIAKAKWSPANTPSPEQRRSAPPGNARPPHGRAFLQRRMYQQLLDAGRTIKRIPSPVQTPTRGRALPLMLRVTITTAKHAHQRLIPGPQLKTG